MGIGSLEGKITRLVEYDHAFMKNNVLEVEIVYTSVYARVRVYEIFSSLVFKNKSYLT